MTSESFLQTVETLSGLLPEMTDSLKAMAPSMTETQRSEAIAALKPLNDEILLKQIEIEQGVLAQEEALGIFKKTRVPVIKAIVTEREQREADAMIDAATAA